MSDKWIELTKEESERRQNDYDREWCCPYWEKLMRDAPCDDCDRDCKNPHICEDIGDQDGK